MKSKRRANGEGSVGRHPNGKWWARLRLPDGRRKAFYSDFQSEVVRQLDEAKAAIKAGVNLSTDRVTVKQHSQEWLAAIQPTIARRTYVTYECLLRLHILPSLGRKHVSRLQPREIQAVYLELSNKGMTRFCQNSALAVQSGRAKSWLNHDIYAANSVIRADHLPVKISLRVDAGMDSSSTDLALR